MKKPLVLFCLFLFACNRPPEDTEARTYRLGQQLRCPVCRGVSIADSPSALAVQMVEVVRNQVKEGKSDQEILKYFEERYGEWALLKPKPQGMNLMIWILPILMVFGGSAAILLRLQRPSEKETL